MVEKLISKILGKRLKKRSKKPKFSRQEGYRYKKLRECWRKPRGRHSKLRMARKARGKVPSIGYGTQKEARGLTKGGLKPVVVSNVAELRKISPESDAAVIGSSVGRKKRREIILEAEKTKIRVLNAYKFRLQASGQGRE